MYYTCHVLHDIIVDVLYLLWILRRAITLTWCSMWQCNCITTNSISTVVDDNDTGIYKVLTGYTVPVGYVMLPALYNTLYSNYYYCTIHIPPLTVTTCCLRLRLYLTPHTTTAVITIANTSTTAATILLTTTVAE